MLVKGYNIGPHANLNRADLRWANLNGANLTRADLNAAHLNGVNLRLAILSEANLNRANLRVADLCEANLNGADLCEADLCEANFRRAILCDANLRGANLNGANLWGANLRGAKGVACLGYRNDGHRFVLSSFGGGRISAGCRWFTLPEALAHWSDPGYRDKSLANDALARVAMAQALLPQVMEG